jgi:peptidoglycan/xylan/chitin deacetylase (PgdA/CDA1 family)
MNSSESHTANRPVGRRRSGTADVLILGYHAVSEDWTSTLSVTPEALQGQLEFLVSKGYVGATFTEAALTDHAGKVVALTFDDGYSSVGELAGPILDHFGFPGTVFVPTRFMGSNQPMSWDGIDQWVGTPQEHELLPMSWEGLRSLAEAGWEIGSHTVSHPRLTTIGDDDLREELVASREECGRMVGETCRSIAFPYGDCDTRVIEASREAGYSAVATIPWRLARSGSFVWPRTGVFREDGEGVFRMKVSPTLRRLRASRVSAPLGPLIHFVRHGRGREDPNA